MNLKIPTNKKHKQNNSQRATQFMPQHIESQKILYERALYLAKPETKKTETSHVTDYIRFRLGESECYGISYLMAKEVLHKTDLTKVPGAPDFIAGVINRYGMLLTILDLKRFFQIKGDVQQNAYIIIVALHSITIGMLVDYIEGSNSYDTLQIDAPFSSNVAIKPEYILGLHDGETAIINVESVISDLLKKLTK
jgi:purine-binding chemotaxis protein CheW